MPMILTRDPGLLTANHGQNINNPIVLGCIPLLPPKKMMAFANNNINFSLISLKCSSSWTVNPAIVGHANVLKNLITSKNCESPQ